MKRPAKSYQYWKTTVPIYGFDLHLVVAKCPKAIGEARTALANIFGPNEVGVEYTGLCCYSGRNFGVFLAMDKCTHGVVAHEVFHVVCRMMEWIESDLTKDRHEPHAYLLEWVTDWVYQFVKPKRERPLG
jgi:hypothetical protein